MKYTIYGKTGCSACGKAEALLNAKELDYEYVLLGLNYSLDEFYSVAPKSHKTFPMIAINGEYLGGFHELQQILNGDSL